ncbi:hypothetical protein SDRG_05582 [Saprolegnia diclina VS20]|uniref:Uncharacterized protein n=1 Tax=Saprolegnia diclina (strain VS20) TaxID=1156394 RepID=T0QTM7_SAPDV|nr:hypothetical protein SDRG_05582 [Saprolegnia diclina VS20]EQC37365.1 hypothetical protein SDRG_05582 [Saprolegnia diclina VS20]|eukprot:XP_008609527.1 hypothetical protein SDRG_05582 [Saprolegnia diclina VS20]
MASFASTVLGLPPIAALVFSYQHGVYACVRHRFVEFATAVGFDAATDGRYHLCRHVQSRLDHPLRSVSTLSVRELFLFSENDRDIRFVLHLAIYEGDAAAVARILACADDLFSENAIDMAIFYHLSEIAAHLLSHRATVLQHGRTVHRHGWRHELPALVAKRNARAALKLLSAYYATPFGEHWAVDAIIAAVKNVCLDSVRYLYEAHPETKCARVLAAVVGTPAVVAALEPDGSPLSAVDEAAANGYDDDNVRSRLRGGRTEIDHLEHVAFDLDR